MHMGFDEYQQLALKTAIHRKNKTISYALWALGLVGESGEVAEKYKKIIRNQNSALNESDKTEIKKELGDVLWYLSIIAHSLDTRLSEIAKINLEKISDRKTRGTIKGAGDNR